VTGRPSYPQPDWHFAGAVTSSSAGHITLRTSEGLELQSETSGDWPPGSDALLAIRPERLRVSREPSNAYCNLHATVRAVIFGGNWTRMELTVSASRTAIVETRGHESSEYLEGDRVWISYDPRDMLALRTVE
jgi:ABC-type Fe3+/spermidine/putrescine transport system ATPase subunit